MADQDDLISKLERLQHLRDANVITQAELDAQKAALLGQPAPPASCAECGAPLLLTPDRRCIYCGTVAPAAATGAPVVAMGNEAIAAAAFANNPNKKIMAIKEVREKTGLGLKEAKELVDAAEQRAAGR